jgi:hypothetical protein
MKVFTGKQEQNISVYPNPVTGNTIYLQINNISNGIYRLQLLTASGQLIKVKTFRHNASDPSETLEIPRNLPAGKYDLKLTGKGIQLNTHLIKK